MAPWYTDRRGRHRPITSGKQWRYYAPPTFPKRFSFTQRQFPEPVLDNLIPPRLALSEDTKKQVIDDILRRSEPKPVEQKTVEERVGTPSYLKALSIVFICFVLIVFGIPFVLAFFYVAQGFSSVAIYSPPIGEVMSFYYMAATLLATVSAAPAVIIAALLAVPKFRRFAFAAFERSPAKNKS